MSAPEPARELSLRRVAARGSVINAVFLVAVTSLSLLKGLVVVGFLSRHDYGVWGLLAGALGSLGALKEVGIADRYVQQRDADQELAFQQAFTLEVLLDGALTLVLLAVVPLLVLGYGRSELLAPGIALALTVPMIALQSPLWIFYRRMDFARQRWLGAIDPVTEFVVAVALAAAGAGYWSLIGGVLAGNLLAAAIAVRSSPYRLAWRFSRQAARHYLSFSWPIFGAALGGMICAQGAVIVGAATLGLSGVGAIALASSIVSYTTQVDRIVSDALYPAVCAVRDRADLLLESFGKANRLGLMWGAPFGVGIALFAAPLVRFGFGEHWTPAVGLMQVFGLIAAFDQIAYNWDDYFRARSDTRPLAVVSGVATGLYLAVAMPLLIADGLSGFAVGMAVASVGGVLGRLVYLSRLFPTLDVMRHIVRAAVPTAAGALAVLAVRWLGAGHGLGAALGEFALYLAVTASVTVWLERPLLRELGGYLGPRAPSEPLRA